MDNIHVGMKQQQKSLINYNSKKYSSENFICICIDLYLIEKQCVRATLYNVYITMALTTSFNLIALISIDFFL